MMSDEHRSTIHENTTSIYEMTHSERNTTTTTSSQKDNNQRKPGDPETTVEIAAEEEDGYEQKPFTLISYYFAVAWAGISIPYVSQSFQIFFDCFWIFNVPIFGTVYCLYLITMFGVWDSIMWLFIELGAIGCWSTFFYALRWKMAYKPFTFSKEVWRDDLRFVLVGVVMYTIIAGVYFSKFSELLGSLPIYGKVIEGYHGITFWSRFGATAVTAQAFYASASTRIDELHKLRLSMEKELQQALSTRKETILVPPPSRFRSNERFISTTVTTRIDLLGQWIEQNRRTRATNQNFSWFIGILISMDSLAFLTWSLNNLIYKDSPVNSIVAGTVILGTTVTTIFVIAIASQLTSEMEKSAAMAAEYWYCTPQTELRILYPGLATSITLHLLQRNYATKIFDFSISKNFLFEFLGAVTSLTLAVLRLQATLV